MYHVKRDTLIHSAEPFDAARHNVLMLNSGSEYIETQIQWRAGKAASANYAEFVFTTPIKYDGRFHVIAYASGELVSHDHDSRKPLDVPRIDLQLVAVDQHYQGMGLGRAVSARVIDALYAEARMPVIEVRSIDPIGSYSSAMRRSCGFKPIAGSAHLSLTVCPDELQKVRAWPLNLRPGIIILHSTMQIPLEKLELAFDLSGRKDPGVTLG